MKRAFTLIELLVVISITALLLALLLPALSKAQELSRITECASRLRQQGIAALNFAGDRDGWLPQMRVPLENPPRDHDDYSLYANCESRFFMNRGNRGKMVSSMGPVFFAGYFPSGEALYCPSQRHPAFQYETYRYPTFPSASVIGISAVRVGYNHNPMTRGPDPRELPGGYGRDRRYQRVDQFIPGKVMLGVDLLSENDIQTPDVMAHRDRWNVMHEDTSVRLRIDPQILEIRAAHGTNWTLHAWDAYHDATNRLMGDIDFAWLEER